MKDVIHAPTANLQILVKHLAPNFAQGAKEPLEQVAPHATTCNSVITTFNQK